MMFENQNAARITIRDIESKQFRRVAYGYEQQGVDEFLDDICDELERLYEEINDLKRKVELAGAQTRMADAESGAVAAPVGTSESFQDILKAAQRVKEQVIADAEKKAEEIVDAAKLEAEARLGGLNEERKELEETVSTLRTAAQDYKTKFGDLLREHQEVLARISLNDEE